MALAKSVGQPFLFVELVASEQTLQRRLRERQTRETVSDAREDLLARIRDEYQPATEIASGKRLVLNGERPVEELVKEVRSAVSRNPDRR